jgi:putative Holliday junction resolvase
MGLPPGPALGLDLGERRIGVAVSDSARRLATPLVVLERGRDRGEDDRAIASLLASSGATTVVVGVPIGMDGRVGPAARAALEEADRLAQALGVQVETVDERLTTVEATRRLAEAARRGRGRHCRPQGASPAGSGGRRARRRVDDAAAALILQAWIDRRRPAR